MMTFRSLSFALCLFSLLQFSSSVTGEDWPQFRGPTQQGHSTEKGLPLKWDTKTNVEWKTPLPGNGWSSPIVYKGNIYMTAAVPLKDGERGPQSLRVLGVRKDSGELFLNKEIFKQGKSRKHNKNSHASSTPIASDDQVFIHFGPHGTACLDLKGNVVWAVDNINYSPVHGNGGSPVLVGDSLIFSCDGAKDPFVISLNRKTGKRKWIQKRPKAPGRQFAFCTPLLLDLEGQQQVIIPGANTVSAYEPRKGKELWRVRYPGGYSVVPRPVYNQGLVYISTGYDEATLLAIRPTGKGDVTETHVAWKARKSIPKNASFVIVGEELFYVADNGVATCVDAKTGTKIHWRKRLKGGHSTSPVVVDGKIYFQNEEGDTYVVKADKNYELLSKNSLEERTLASFAVSDGAFYIRTEKGLWKIKK